MKFFFECTYCGKRYEISYRIDRCSICGDKNIRRLKSAEKYNVFGYEEDSEDGDYFEPLD